MKKFIAAAVLLAVLVPFAAAQGKLTPKEPLPKKTETAGLQSVKQERAAKISAITAKVQDINARYYARQVQQGQVMIGSLESASKSWLGLPEQNAQLIALIKEYARGPEVPDLTWQELDQLDENNREVQRFLHNGRENPAAAKLAEMNRKIRELKEPVFELDARYWAWRVAVVKDTTMDELEGYAKNWVGERSYNQKLIAKIRENVQTGNTKKLTKEEEKKLNKVTKQVRKLLKQY